MQFSYSNLRTEGARSAFFEWVLTESQDPTEELNHILGYVAFLKEGLTSCGLEEDEATRSAADTVFGGLSKYVHDSDRTRFVDELDGMDRLIRDVHDIDPRILPKGHEDPLVASFYDKLEGHLNRAQAVDRFSGF